MNTHPDSKKILITGGAGFIGSNLVDYFLDKGHKIVVLDNLATGFEHNINHHFGNPDFEFIKADIRDIDVCREAVKGCDYVLHQAALGSVPRSIKDPATTNAVNISGFLNMLIAARDEGVKRFIYAASSSTYGDSKKLPKVEDEIGKPLSPYAITKYVNELYADVFAKTYGMQCIGLRYFNVFGRRQTPDGAYAAVIPLWVKKMIRHEQPVINGDGSYSRDFTYIENVIQANEKALFTSDEDIARGQREYYNVGLDAHKYFNEQADKPEDNRSIAPSDNHPLAPSSPRPLGQSDNRSIAPSSPRPLGQSSHRPIVPSDNRPLASSENHLIISEVFNVAYGGNTNLIQLFEALRDNLAKYDPEIQKLQPEFGPFRPGDIPHSQASIKKAEMILGYKPEYDARTGFERVAEWYYKSLK
jgi:UDP-N-acetylglucosamine 4-epimerase